MGRRVVRRRPGGPRVLLSRLFVAVFPSEEAREHLRGHLPSRVARRPEKWHVTLAFLGEVPDEDTDRVRDALSTVPPPSPMTLRLAGSGRFGPVIWTGLRGDVEALEAFREEIRVALEGAGFPIDERPFRGHLTISYRYDRSITTLLADYAGPLWPVSDLSLIRSAGGEYVTVWERPLPR
ncbi:RNA 2',3'-cyclic phosphodiesterase [Actinoplanes sp. NPDC023801]|uniref:RNA 2',3'-cyclic phosphodiesterase n=1 Tax=Actinoplanes sp. NPDC023801 TaxID=3154595 RepID=UPI0033E1F733